MQRSAWLVSRNNSIAPGQGDACVATISEAASENPPREGHVVRQPDLNYVPPVACADGEATDEDKAEAKVADRIGAASGGDLPELRTSVEDERGGG